MKTILLTMEMIVITITLYFSCSTPVTTDGGTGTETVNTFAMRPDGTPAAGAIVQVIEARWWIDSVFHGASPVLRQTVADKNGGFKLEFPERDAIVNLQIDHGDGALLMPLQDSAHEGLDTLRLRPASSYSGKFADGGALPLQVMLAGTSYRAPVDATGSFSFHTVAPGSYALLSVNDTSSSTPVITDGIALTVGEGTALDQHSLPAIADRLLIDNFESGIGPTSLGRIFPVLGWYVLSDSLYYLWDPAAGIWKEETVTRIGTSPITYDSVADGNGGRAFTFSAVLDRTSPYANALIGFTLKPLSDDGIDLSMMNGFSFRASGKGTICVRFESKGLDSVSNYLYQYACPLPLNGTMQQYAIPVDSLRIMGPVESTLYTSSRYPWKTVSKNIMRIEFEFSANENVRGDSLSCVLDDFYLEGVSVTALLSAPE